MNAIAKHIAQKKAQFTTINFELNSKYNWLEIHSIELNITYFWVDTNNFAL